ncbi:hypothetical protein DGG96_18960 [Legionella qingyii]|uniref:Uncharacterized protein n=1 Tax=Legionella qingyii TaxID=2184757 RepID=A0A317TXE6_9GAMM|nr:hypothetical protein DGG96_18960 [Legionella qingyii]
MDKTKIVTSSKGIVVLMVFFTYRTKPTLSRFYENENRCIGLVTKKFHVMKDVILMRIGEPSEDLITNVHKNIGYNDVVPILNYKVERLNFNSATKTYLEI